MGLIFKKFQADTYCKKCDTTYYKQSGAFSELAQGPLKCQKCDESLYLPGYNVADFYVLRGTNKKISSKSHYAKIFILIPSLIVMGIPFLLIIFWAIDVINYAFNDAIKKALLVPMWLRLYGTDWPSIFPLLLILYFLFQLAVFICNHKESKKREEDLARLRHLAENKNRIKEE